MSPSTLLLVSEGMALLPERVVCYVVLEVLLLFVLLVSTNQSRAAPFLLLQSPRYEESSTDRFLIFFSGLAFAR